MITLDEMPVEAPAPQGVVATPAVAEPQPEQPKGPKVPPSFVGELTVQWPVTEAAWVLKPVEAKGKNMESKWSYPSPMPTIEEACGDDDAKWIAKFVDLAGPAAVVYALEIAYAALCQDRWKTATAKHSDDLSEASKLFAQLFHDGKQRRESTSAASMRTKAGKLLKDALELKQREGMSEKVKDLVTQAKALQAKALEMDMAEIAELEAAGGK